LAGQLLENDDEKVRQSGGVPSGGNGKD